MHELFRVSERLPDPGLRLQAFHCGWTTRIFRGDLATSEEYTREGLALYDREAHRDHSLIYGGHDPAVCGLAQGALAQWLLGRPDQAARRVRETMALADTLPHLPSRGHALYFGGIAHLMWRDAVAALDYGERLAALGAEHGFALYPAAGSIARGWARTQLGEIEPGLGELRDAITDYLASAKVMLSFYTTLLAETELRSGHADLARAALASATALSEDTGETLWAAEIRRLGGDLLIAASPPDPDAAERCYREALAIAREQEARSLELRAATSLARLWRQQERHDEARDLLAPLYGWFTEGFDTLDLVEAKALLDALS